jgi:bifunctional non-homologous end joining protein LigD
MDGTWEVAPPAAVERCEVIITHPEKIMFPDEGITKGELASYYETIAPVMLPHLRRRPITMERFHRGIAAPGFFQKDVSKGFPEWLERVEVPKHGARKRGEIRACRPVADKPRWAGSPKRNCWTAGDWKGGR